MIENIFFKHLVFTNLFNFGCTSDDRNISKDQNQTLKRTSGLIQNTHKQNFLPYIPPCEKLHLSNEC